VTTDATGLAYVYFEDEAGRRMTMKRVTKDEARPDRRSQYRQAAGALLCEARPDRRSQYRQAAGALLGGDAAGLGFRTRTIPILLAMSKRPSKRTPAELPWWKVIRFKGTPASEIG
jgi:hypothetical protein